MTNKMAEIIALTAYALAEGKQPTKEEILPLRDLQKSRKNLALALGDYLIRLNDLFDIVEEDSNFNESFIAGKVDADLATIEKELLEETLEEFASTDN